MKRQLILVRHAEAESHASGGDHDRALSAHGVSQAQGLARWLQEEEVRPDMMLVSNARRTQETANILQAAWGGRGLRFDSEPLYLADPEEVLGQIEAVDAGLCTVLLVGHNPGLSVLAAELARPRFIDGLATAGLVEFAVESPGWRHFSAHDVRFRRSRNP